MGFLSPYSKTDTVKFEDGFWAEVKLFLDTDDETACQKAMLKVVVDPPQNEGDQPNIRTEFDQGAFLKEKAARALVAWNLTDKDDVPLPSATLEERRASVGLLPSFAVKLIAAAVQDEPRKGEEAKQFPAGTAVGGEVGEEWSTGTE